MTEASIVYHHTSTKRKIVNDFIMQYMGYEPSKEERRMFTTMHRLNETRIYFKGNLVAHLRYYLKEGTLFAEYLYY